MKLIWKGNLFNPTGIATAYRELVRALLKKGVRVQASDIWHSGYEFNKGLEVLNYPIDAKTVDYTIFADYPQFWRDGYGKIVTHFLHEGTRLPEGWSQILNTADLVMVPSQATKNLFRINGIMNKIKIVPFGVNDLYKPVIQENQDFIFLFVNSWTGEKGDRKGTDILIKAFNEEFRPDEKVKLVLKISTFWRKQSIEFYIQKIQELLGKSKPNNILLNVDYIPEDKLVEHYQNADCFVMPTRSESFGLTAINAMACGLPLIITKDNNSGYMDFCRGKDSVLWIDAPNMEQADRHFYVEGNLQPIPDIESLKKQMRYAFEHRELKEKAIKNSEEIRKNWTWSASADKFIKVLKDNFNDK